MAIAESTAASSKPETPQGALATAFDRSANMLICAGWGLVVGAGLAMATDALVLGREKVVVHRAPPPVAWSPIVSPREGGATAGLAGQF